MRLVPGLGDALFASLAKDETEAEPATAPTRRAKVRLENKVFKTVPFRADASASIRALQLHQ